MISSHFHDLLPDSFILFWSPQVMNKDFPQLSFSAPSWRNVRKMFCCDMLTCEDVLHQVPSAMSESSSFASRYPDSMWFDMSMTTKSMGYNIWCCSKTYSCQILYYNGMDYNRDIGRTQIGRLRRGFRWHLCSVVVSASGHCLYGGEGQKTNAKILESGDDCMTSYRVETFTWSAERTWTLCSIGYHHGIHHSSGTIAA